MILSKLDKIWNDNNGYGIHIVSIVSEDARANLQAIANDVIRNIYNLKKQGGDKK